MVVRRAAFRAGIDVRQDAETHFRVLIDHLPLGLILRREIGPDHVLANKNLLKPVDDLVQRGIAGTVFQMLAAFRCEFLDDLAHGYFLL